MNANDIGLWGAKMQDKLDKYCAGHPLPADYTVMEEDVILNEDELEELLDGAGNS